MDREVIARMGDILQCVTNQMQHGEKDNEGDTHLYGRNAISADRFHTQSSISSVFSTIISHIHATAHHESRNTHVRPEVLPALAR
jgi:hypothetical protein